MSHDNEQPSLLKQLLGAAVGSAVALALYGVYTFASPHLTALIRMPTTEGQDVDYAGTTLTEDLVEYERQANRNRIQAQHFAASDDPFEDIADRAKEFQDTLDDDDRQQIDDTLEGDDAMMEEDVPDDSMGEYPLEADVMDSMGPMEDSMPPADVMMDDAEVEHVPAESLPDSGFGLWLSGLIALAAVGAMRGRKFAAEWSSH